MNILGPKWSEERGHDNACYSDCCLHYYSQFEWREWIGVSRPIAAASPQHQFMTWLSYCSVSSVYKSVLIVRIFYISGVEKQSSSSSSSGDTGSALQFFHGRVAAAAGGASWVSQPFVDEVQNIGPDQYRLECLNLDIFLESHYILYHSAAIWNALVFLPRELVFDFKS